MVQDCRSEWNCSCFCKYDFKKLFWKDELNSRVCCAFGNVWVYCCTTFYSGDFFNDPFKRDFFANCRVRRHIPMRHIPIATFTHATFTHRRHLPIASIRYDAWSIRYLIDVAYGYLSRENWDLIGAMGKCRQWVNVAYHKETAGHGQLSEETVRAMKKL